MSNNVRVFQADYTGRIIDASGFSVSIQASCALIGLGVIILWGSQRGREDKRKEDGGGNQTKFHCAFVIYYCVFGGRQARLRKEG